MSISDSFSAALSGMLAASAQMSSAASNIANLNTPGYQAIRRDLSPLADDGGVAVGPITIDPSYGPAYANGQAGSNVYLTNAIGQMDSARTLYDANAAVIRSTSQMTGTLLNIFDNDDNG